MTRRGWLLFAAMCVIWGVPYLLIRVAVRDIAPGTLVCLRTGIGGLLLLPFALSSGGVAGFVAVWRRWPALVAFSAIEMAGPWVLLGDAEQHLSSSLTGLLIAAVPLVGVLIARLTHAADASVGRLRALGLVLGLGGVVVLLGLDLGKVHAGSLVELAFVVVGYAIAPVVLSRYLSDLPSLPVVCSSLVLVALGYAPYAALRWPSSVSAHAAWSVAGLAVVCTALAFIVFFALIGETGPARATVFTYVNPAVALLLGVLLLGEPFTVGIAIGSPLILAGSVLAARAGPVAATREVAARAFDDSAAA